MRASVLDQGLVPAEEACQTLAQEPLDERVPLHVALGRTEDPRIRVLALGRDVGTCFGGAERVAFELVKRLDRQRFKRYLCITHARPPERRAINESELLELEGSGVEVLRLERRSLLSTIAWARLYELLRRESIDILHAHMPRASVPGTVLGRLAGVPVIVNHEHGWAFRGKPLRRFLDRNLLARGGSVMLAVSECDRRRMIELERIPAERIRVLPNGVAPATRNGSDVRSEFGVSPETGLIGAVGRLYPQKGYDDLIRATALLKRDSPRPIHCVIVGHGPEEQSLQALIDDLDLADEVRLVGRRQDVPDVIGGLDVAVLSSRHEGSPLAVMEYMAEASPIVATAVGGVPEQIQDGVHGLLVKPGDPRELAAAIGRLLDDRRLAWRLGQAAQERQRAKFDLDVVVTRLEDLYSERCSATLRARRRGSRVEATRMAPLEPGQAECVVEHQDGVVDLLLQKNDAVDEPG
jgi:glycosyltransferase involved in cell wall biosynthesis